MKLFGFKNLPWNSDNSDPRQRFIYFDGSPYGSKGLSRILSSPLVQGWVASDLLISTLEMATIPHESWDAKMFLSVASLNSIGVGAVAILHWAFYEELPLSKNAVIDKKGHNNGDPTASAALSSAYLVDATFSAALVPMMMAATSVWGMPLWLNSLVIGIPAAVSLSPKIIWDVFARSKIESGKWTVHTSPPSIHKKKQEDSLALGGLTTPIRSKRSINRAINMQRIFS